MSELRQGRLFNVAGVPMVESCVNGYNSCMFSYGQTGSRYSVNCGMTSRVFEHFFSRIQKIKRLLGRKKK
ncbi:hypothetical protein V2J09_001255 [Rumex salicifolius]